MKFKKIYWHDGNIIDFRYIFPIIKKDNPKIIIKAEVYSSLDAPQRQKIQAEFCNIQNVVKNIDFNKLKENVGFGSINYTKQREIARNNHKFQEYTFIIFGGKIKIVSNKAKIKNL